ncbi:hypothetical protein ACIQVC_37325 [Streptomyces sp. NPDC101112]|uniref:hypothetical protein n=1 Tax=Streptomyces sp. NPDC101112 TaxID=3366105 RepID=UPI00382F157B
MRRITAICSAAGVAVAAIATGTVVWLSQPSYDDVVADCAAALKAQYKAGGKGKPDKCAEVKDDDYDALVVQASLDNLGWTDENGEFDKNKMLDDVTQP